MLSSLFEEVLSFLTESEPPPEQLSHRILSRLAEASPAEIEEGLHVLWRFTRHLTRQDCWKHLPAAVLNDSGLRHEIRMYLTTATRRPQAPPTGDHGDVTEGGDTQPEGEHPPELELPAAAPEPLPDEADDVRKKLLEYLPDQYWYLEDHFFATADPNEYPGCLRLTFDLFSKIAASLRERYGAGPLFWGVLGSIEDARCYQDPEGFATETRQGWRYALTSRVRGGHADLWDHWLALDANAPGDAKAAAFDLFMDRVEVATTAEIESLLRAIDSTEEDLVDSIKTVLPDPDRLWASILERRDLTGILLTNAGKYYWDTSTEPPTGGLPLAALAVDPFGPPAPFMYLWEAARVEARSGNERPELTLCCLKLALFDLTRHAPSLREGELLERVSDYQWEPTFIRDIASRMFERANDASIHLLLLRTRTALHRNHVDRFSRVSMTITTLVETLGAPRVAATNQLAADIGPALWGSLAAETKDALTSAVEVWKKVPPPRPARIGGGGQSLAPGSRARVEAARRWPGSAPLQHAGNPAFALQRGALAQPAEPLAAWPP